MDTLKKSLDRTKRSLEEILRQNILLIAIVLAASSLVCEIPGMA